MNNDQLFAYGRQLLTIFGTMLGTWLVSSGKISPSDLSTLGGAITAIGGAALSIAPIVISLWRSFAAHSAEGKLTSVAAMPDVVHVQMAPTSAGSSLAETVPSSKVSISPAHVSGL